MKYSVDATNVQVDKGKSQNLTAAAEKMKTTTASTAQNREVTGDVFQPVNLLLKYAY